MTLSIFVEKTGYEPVPVEEWSPEILQDLEDFSVDTGAVDIVRMEDRVLIEYEDGKEVEYGVVDIDDGLWEVTAGAGEIIKDTYLLDEEAPSYTLHPADFVGAYSIDRVATLFQSIKDVAVYPF